MAAQQARCGSGKAKLPPIPRTTAASSAPGPDDGQGESDEARSTTACQHIGTVLGEAAADCNVLMKQLLQQVQQVEYDIDAKLKSAIKEATMTLEQELRSAQTQFQAEKAELRAEVKQLSLKCADLEKQDKERQQAITDLKQREEMLVTEKEKLNASLLQEKKARQHADDMMAVQNLEHQKAVQQVMDQYGCQLSEIDKSGEESKKRNQQLTTQIKQLREANSKLTSRASEEEALRQKLEKQRKDEHAAHAASHKKTSLELSTLKTQLAQCQQDLVKSNRAAEQYEKQLTRQQAEHGDAMKKMKNHHATITASLDEKIQQLERELTDLRLHYQVEMERLRKEMAEKMHASLDTWLGSDDALLKKLRKQNQEEKGKLDAERHAGAVASKKKSNRS